MVIETTTAVSLRWYSLQVFGIRRSEFQKGHYEKLIQTQHLKSADGILETAW